MIMHAYHSDSSLAGNNLRPRVVVRQIFIGHSDVVCRQYASSAVRTRPVEMQRKGLGECELPRHQLLAVM